MSRSKRLKWPWQPEPSNAHAWRIISAEDVKVTLLDGRVELVFARRHYACGRCGARFSESPEPWKGPDLPPCGCVDLPVPASPPAPQTDALPVAPQKAGAGNRAPAPPPASSGEPEDSLCGDQLHRMRVAPEQVSLLLSPQLVHDGGLGRIAAEDRVAARVVAGEPAAVRAADAVEQWVGGYHQSCPGR